MKIRGDNRGAVLIVSYIVLFALITLSAGLVLFNFNELRLARRHSGEAKAFWLAEAGLQTFLHQRELFSGKDDRVIQSDYGIIKMWRNEDDPTKLVITSRGESNGFRKVLELTFPVKAADAFRHTLSVKGDIVAEGRKTSAMINDKVRLSGKFKNSSKYDHIKFEDKREKIHNSLVSLAYPDANKNGTPDEYDDFIVFNRKLLSQYPGHEVVYIQGNGTFTITPNSKLYGKKVIYVEGDPGRGNVIIPFSGIVQPGQQLTVITTGSVTLNVAGNMPPDSQLNVIAWKNYREAAVLPGIHRGMIFAHEKAYFDDIYDTSVTYGSVVANKGLHLQEIWSTKSFHYADVREGDRVPYGFEGLIGGGTSGYAAVPISWKEI